MPPTGHREAPKLVALIGATASGKSAAALELAGRYSAHVVNYDSVQLYRGLEIGAAKPTPEERARFPHHLYDLGGPDEEITAGAYAKAASALIDDLLSQGGRIILVGGTGLYLRALCKGLSGAPPTEPAMREALESRFAGTPTPAVHEALAKADPLAAERIGKNDRQRIFRALAVFEQTGRPLSDWQASHGFREERYSPALIGLAVKRETLYKRIGERSRSMLEAGLLEETRGLLEKGYPPEGAALSSIGYRQAVEHLSGRMPLEAVLGSLEQDTRRYAKRQLTWWRGETGIEWVPADDDVEAAVGAAGKAWGN
ncbi:MAG: tRNA (adenosine(37)-N6)-dimethylallyltransferase MiaA [Bdellovibrionota bacterium]